MTQNSTEHLALSAEDFLAKLEWEGGIGGLVSYGLAVEDAPPEIREEYAACYAAVQAFEQKCDDLGWSDV